MPWERLKATWTAPVAGWGNSQTYCVASTWLTLAAGLPSTSRSEARTLVTAVLKSTSTVRRDGTAAPAGGIWVTTVGPSCGVMSRT